MSFSSLGYFTFGKSLVFVINVKFLFIVGKGGLLVLVLIFCSLMGLRSIFKFVGFIEGCHVLDYQQPQLFAIVDIVLLKQVCYTHRIILHHFLSHCFFGVSTELIPWVVLVLGLR